MQFKEGSSYLFTHAIARIPGRNFADGLTTAEYGAPDYATARLQHAAYVAALKTACSLQVTLLPGDEKFPDSCFVEDTAVIGTHFAVLTQPGAASRSGEVDAIAGTIKQHFETIYRIEAPGSLDGGDICDADGHFFIGVSHRTNETGARQLADILKAHGHSSELVDIRPIDGILHLKSGISYIGDRRMVLWPEFASMPCFGSFEKIIPSEEEKYAANCIRVNHQVLIAADYPRLHDHLAGLGCQLLPLAMSEFQKMDGGLSCLSLRFTVA